MRRLLSVKSTLGNKIRDLRLKKGITQQQLATSTGVDNSYISKIEKDRLPYPPSAETLRLIAKALETDALELFSLAERNPPELEGLLGAEDAGDFLRVATRHDLRKSDWKALTEFLRERVASNDEKAPKSRK